MNKKKHPLRVKKIREQEKTFPPTKKNMGGGLSARQVKHINANLTSIYELEKLKLRGPLDFTLKGSTCNKIVLSISNFTRLILQQLGTI